MNAKDRDIVHTRVSRILWSELNYLSRILRKPIRNLNPQDLGLTIQKRKYELKKHRRKNDIDNQTVTDFIQAMEGQEE